MQMIRVAIGGDLCPIGRVEKRLVTGSGAIANLFNGVLDAVGERDLFILNLECPLTRSNSLIEKAGACIRAVPEAVRLLRKLDVGLVTLANNHIMDFGEEGLADTLKACRDAGVETVGAGLSYEDATRVHYRELKGRTLAVINMAEREFSCASPGCGGANPFDFIAAVESIRLARKQANHVIVVLHGGLEHMSYPSPESVRTLRFLAEQGPTAIIRHHSHRVQGHEVWKGVPIFYSLGNFLFDWYTPVKEEGWYEGILVELTISATDECSCAVHPFEQCKAWPGIEILEGASKERFMNRYFEWSAAIGDAPALQRKWGSEIERREVEYLGLLTLPYQILVRVARRLGLLRFARPPRANRRILENMLRCDAHREALLNILERDRKERRTS